MDAARAALTRAQTRKAQAEQAAEQANRVVAEAIAEEERYACSLAELEVELARDTSVAAAGAVPDGVDTSDPIALLTANMNAFMVAIKAKPYVNDTHVKNAQTHVQTLIQGFAAALDHANAAAAKHAERKRSPDGAADEMHDADSVPMEPVSKARFTGKQTAELQLVNYFDKPVGFCEKSATAAAFAADVEVLVTV